MDPGVEAAIITGCITFVVAGGGGTLGWVRSRFKARDTEHEKAEARLQARIDQLEREIKLLETAADTKDETIADLRSQRDRLVITAEIQDRFFRQLSPPRRTSGKNDG
jgi:hypothetical protein